MNRKYKQEMQEIHASEELIKNTINKINSKNKSKSYEVIKKLAIGTAAMMMVSVTSFATYVAVTGNTEILKKIGINISEKYEGNKQEIKEKNTNTQYLGEKFEAEIVAISIDSGSAVAEINVKLRDEIETNEIELKVSDLKIYNDEGEENYITYTTRQSSTKQENGTFKCFVYFSVDNGVTMGSDIEAMFMDRDKLPMQIEFSGVQNTDGISIEEDWKFKVNLKKQEENNSVTNVLKKTKIGNIELMIISYQESEFGNTIDIQITQEQCKVDEINRIQKLDFVVKNKNGELVDIISRVDNITMSGYKEGKMTEIGLETKLVVDDITENPNYTIEIVDTDKVLVSKEEIIKINDEIIKDYQADEEWVLTADGRTIYRYDLDETEYYKDEYGIYISDKKYNELVEMSEAEQASEKFWEEAMNQENLNLTEEDIIFFNEYLNKPENIGFVQSMNSYKNAREIGLLNVFSAGIEGIQVSEEEIVEIRKKCNIGVEIKIPVKEGIDILKEKTGIELTKEEFINQMGRIYVEEDNACYIEKLDMNQVECDMGYKTQDGRIVIQLCENGEQTSIVTLQKQGDNYIFISNIGEEPVG